MSFYALKLAFLCTLQPGATQVLEVARSAPAVAPSRPAGARPAKGSLLPLVRARIADALPAGWRMRRVELDDAWLTAMWPGNEAAAAIDLQVHWPEAPKAGLNDVELDLRARALGHARLLAQVELVAASRAKAAPAVARGQEVIVVVRSGNVVVQAKGVTQMAAGLGERVAVLPQSGTHTVQAVVRDARTVEVSL